MNGTNTEGPAVNPAELLQSPEAQFILEAALATIPATLESWEVDAVHARPGAETSVAFDVHADGERLYMVASTVSLSQAQREQASAVRLESDAGTIHVWIHPHDPMLPGLSSVCSAPNLQARMTDIGLGAIEVADLSMLVLRPMRRAVLRAEVVRDEVAETMFVKVLRPDKAALALARHSLVALAPRAFAAGDGVILNEAASGQPLTEYLYRPDGPREVNPMALVGALDSIDPGAVDLPRRRSPAELIATYAESAICAGWDRASIDDVARSVTEVLSEGYGEVVATHGDFHAANLFVDAGVPAQVTALIDIDTVGPGLRADDLACMLAHLYTLPTFDEEAYPGVPDLVKRMLREFSELVPQRQLRARAAAVLVSLLTGCEDKFQGQLWLDRALWLVGKAQPLA